MASRTIPRRAWASATRARSARARDARTARSTTGAVSAAKTPAPHKGTTRPAFGTAVRASRSASGVALQAEHARRSCVSAVATASRRSAPPARQIGPQAQDAACPAAPALCQLAPFLAIKRSRPECSSQRAVDRHRPGAISSAFPWRDLGTKASASVARFRHAFAHQGQPAPRSPPRPRAAGRSIASTPSRGTSGLVLLAERDPGAQAVDEFSSAPVVEVVAAERVMRHRRWRREGGGLGRRQRRREVAPRPLPARP